MDTPPQKKEDLVKYHVPGRAKPRVLRGVADTATNPKVVIVRRREGGDREIPWDRVISIRRGTPQDGATS